MVFGATQLTVPILVFSIFFDSFFCLFVWARNMWFVAVFGVAHGIPFFSLTPKIAHFTFCSEKVWLSWTTRVLNIVRNHNQ